MHFVPCVEFKSSILERIIHLAMVNVLVIIQNCHFGLDCIVFFFLSCLHLFTKILNAVHKQYVRVNGYSQYRMQYSMYISLLCTNHYLFILFFLHLFIYSYKIAMLLYCIVVNKIWLTNLEV